MLCNQDLYRGYFHTHGNPVVEWILWTCNVARGQKNGVGPSLCHYTEEEVVGIPNCCMEISLLNVTGKVYVKVLK